MSIKCPCRELDELRRFKAEARKQMAGDEKRIKELEAELLIVSRRNTACNSVFQSVWEENKLLQAKVESLTQEVASRAKVVRCIDCKHVAREENNGIVHYCCRNSKGLGVITKQSFCCYGEVDDGT